MSVPPQAAVFYVAADRRATLAQRIRQRFIETVILRQPLTDTTIAFVNSRLLRILFLSCLVLAADADRVWAQANTSSTRVRRVILQSRHLGAHGMGYNDQSMSELSRELSPVDIPKLIALLTDRTVRVGAQFALASQCEASILPVREAAKQHQMNFLDALDVMDLISGFTGCPPVAREEARAMRDEVDQLRKNEQVRIAEETKRKAENDARIQANSIKMMDPSRAKELTREEREEVYRRSLKAMGLNEKGPLTPAQQQMVDRMYRTMVLGEASAPPRQ